MTDKEALLVAIEALHYCEALNRDVDERKMQAITVVRKLWTEHAMRETQRLGQEIEQEPVTYWKEHAQGLQRDYDSLLADFQAQQEERNFCQRCGKRTKDIHTCTPPQPYE